MSVCEPIYRKIDNPYSTLDNPYSKLCAPGEVIKLFEDGAVFLFEDGTTFIYN